MFLDYCDYHHEPYPKGGKCPICSGLLKEDELAKPWQRARPTVVVSDSYEPMPLQELNPARFVPPAPEIVTLTFKLPTAMSETTETPALSAEYLYAIGEMEAELARAKTLFPERFVNAHEGYAVIFEELDELWEEVKKNQKHYDLPAQRKEAIQLAAMAIRFAAELTRPDYISEEPSHHSLDY
jgi:hypothetical protein